MLPEIQSAKDLQLQIAYTKDKKKSPKQRQLDNYDRARKIVFEKYGLQLPHPNAIKKVKKNKLFLNGEPKNALPSDIFLKDDLIIIEGTENLSQLEECDNRIKALMYFMMQNKSKSCIGRSHTLIELLKEQLAERRIAKSKIMNYNSKSYCIKSNRARRFINKTNMKLPKGIYMPKSTRDTGMKTYRSDLYHIIEKLNKFSLGLAYDFVTEFARIEEHLHNQKFSILNKMYK